MVDATRSMTSASHVLPHVARLRCVRSACSTISVRLAPGKISRIRLVAFSKSMPSIFRLAMRTNIQPQVPT